MCDLGRSGSMHHSPVSPLTHPMEYLDSTPLLKGVGLASPHTLGTPTAISDLFPPGAFPLDLGNLPLRTYS